MTQRNTLYYLYTIERESNMNLIINALRSDVIYKQIVQASPEKKNDN